MSLRLAVLAQRVLISMKAQIWHIHEKASRFKHGKSVRKSMDIAMGLCKRMWGEGKKRARELKFWIRDQWQQQQYWAPEGSLVEKKCLERALSSTPSTISSYPATTATRENSSSSELAACKVDTFKCCGQIQLEKERWGTCKEKPLRFLPCSRLVGFNHLLPAVKST